MIILQKKNCFKIGWKIKNIKILISFSFGLSHDKTLI